MSTFQSELVRYYRERKYYFFALKLTRNAEEAQDLLQETFRKALSGEKNFEVGSNMAAWLTTIMSNAFIDMKRRARRTAGHVLIDDHSKDLESEARQFHTVELREALQEIAKLETGQRRTLTLAVIAGLDYEAIAADTGVAVGTVKSRISRGRRRLAPYRASDNPD